MSPTTFRDTATRVINIEIKAIQDLLQRVDDAFERACTAILHCPGRVVVTGMGKSGHIGNKIAATLASTGTPAFFVHPGEASHGDMGMITSDDTVIAISNSGSTHEVVTIVPLIKRMGAKLICMTGNPESALGKAADVHLDISVSEEACPLGLAPTSSTTATLVMGDALAIALLEARGFTAEDFAFSHPGGRLGRRLLLKLADVMHSDDAVPRVPLGTTVIQSLLEISQKGLGMTTVIDENQRLVGIYTDGDLRRSLEAGIDTQSALIDEVMTKNCHTIPVNSLAAEALKQMEDHRINGLVVIDADHRPIGALNMQDLLKAGVV